MIKKLLCCILCLSCLNAFAQTHRNEIGFETDDDSYLAQGYDRYYTAGTFFFFRHALKPDSAHHQQNKVLGFEIGQKLFTPQSGSINYTGVDDPRYIDRPFAAYLYAGANLNLLYKDESNLKLGAQIGVVGPAALGRPIQDFIHNTFGLYHPSGWEYQVDNDFEVNLSANYNRLLARGDWADISLTSYANLGNGFTGAGVGPLIRLGNFNQLFNSESTQSTAINSRNFKPLHDHELFFYYQPQLNFVAYDATVQGSLFSKRSATSIEVTRSPEPVVFSNQLGVGYSGKRLVIDFAVIFHTKDVKTMTQSDDWGDVTLLYRFH
jgi:lipid A 3-O-deacylase